MSGQTGRSGGARPGTGPKRSRLIVHVGDRFEVGGTFVMIGKVVEVHPDLVIVMDNGGRIRLVPAPPPPIE